MVDETSQPSCGQRLLEAEQVIRDSGVAHTVLRLGGIYGPGRERLLRQLRGGERSPAAPVRYSNRIHRDDAVGILLFLLQRAAAGAALADLYLGVDTESAPLTEVEQWFSDYLGLRYAELSEQAGEQRGGNRRCSSQRLQALGYQLFYPTYSDGVTSFLREPMA